MRRLSWILVALALAGCEDERRREDPKPAEAEDSAGDSLAEYSRQQAALKRAQMEAEARRAAEVEAEAEMLRLEEEKRLLEEELAAAMQAVEDAKTEVERQEALKRLGEAKVEAKKRPKPGKGVKLSDDCLSNPLGC